MKNRTTVKGEVRTATGVILLIFSLFGVLLFVISLALPAGGEAEGGGAAGGEQGHTAAARGERHNFLKEFTRELGIVLLTVCGVSMVYELFVAERHFGKFSEFLYKQIERGESNAAVCERLGIHEIFTSRALYEAKYPLSEVVREAGDNARLRIIARSLYLVMNKPEPLKRALEKGFTLEFCCFDPSADASVLSELAFLEVSDIIAALARFKREFVSWLDTAAPPGRVELRYHGVHVFDSYFHYNFGGHELGAWDLSFGRDVNNKRIFVVDTTKELGANLEERYDMIWKMATQSFVYDAGTVSVNKLPS